MILSKNDLHRYLEADQLALGRRNTFQKFFFGLFFPDYIWNFQKLLRKLEFYKNTKNSHLLSNLIYIFLKYKYRKASLRLGFTIPENVFGPGLAIVHYGNIIINENARIGANCRIHVGVNIGSSGGSLIAPKIGNNVYIGPGVKIFGNIKIANNIAIGANSVVNKSFLEENILLAGIPAKKIKLTKIRSLMKRS